MLFCRFCGTKKGNKKCCEFFEGENDLIDTDGHKKLDAINTTKDLKKAAVKIEYME